MKASTVLIRFGIASMSAMLWLGTTKPCSAETAKPTSSSLKKLKEALAEELNEAKKLKAPIDGEDVVVTQSKTAEQDRTIQLLDRVQEAVERSTTRTMARQALQIESENAEKEVEEARKRRAEATDDTRKQADLELDGALKRKQLIVYLQSVVDLASPALSSDPAKSEDIEFAKGSKLRVGLSLSLLSISTSRNPAEPARLRNYSPSVDAVPPQIGVQFTHQPSIQPWRLRKKDHGGYQLLSWGGMLLFRASDKHVNGGAVSLGFTLNAFNNLVGLGFGFDLYRGVPVQGADGVRGSATAHTGLLGWAFSPKGEITPENMFFVVSLGVDPIVSALGGAFK